MLDRDMSFEEAIAHVEILRLRRRKKSHASMRAELAKLIKSKKGLSDSLLAEAILAAGYRKCDNKTPSIKE